MAMKRIRRVIKVVCPHCLGLGQIATTHGRLICEECKGTGEVDKVITELVEEK